MGRGWDRGTRASSDRLDDQRRLALEDDGRDPACDRGRILRLEDSSADGDAGGSRTHRFPKGMKERDLGGRPRYARDDNGNRTAAQYVAEPPRVTGIVRLDD